MKKRVPLLMLALVFGFYPAAAYAADGDEDQSNHTTGVNVKVDLKLGQKQNKKAEKKDANASKKTGNKTKHGDSQDENQSSDTQGDTEKPSDQDQNKEDTSQDDSQDAKADLSGTLSGTAQHEKNDQYTVGSKIEVTNKGQQPANNAELRLQLPKNVTAQGYDYKGDHQDATGHSLSIDLGSIKPNSEDNYTLSEDIKLYLSGQTDKTSETITATVVSGDNTSNIESEINLKAMKDKHPQEDNRDDHKPDDNNKDHDGDKDNNGNHERNSDGSNEGKRHQEPNDGKKQQENHGDPNNGSKKQKGNHEQHHKKQKKQQEDNDQHHNGQKKQKENDDHHHNTHKNHRGYKDDGNKKNNKSSKNQHDAKHSNKAHVSPKKNHDKTGHAGHSGKVNNGQENNNHKSDNIRNVNIKDVPKIASSGYGAQLINQAASKYNISPALILAIIHQESHFNVNAISSAGAVGLMQLMPGNCRANGYSIQACMQPQNNIDVGASMIAGSLKSYNGNVVKALAAYNAGAGSVAQYGGVPPYAETMQYVRRVPALMKQYEAMLQNGKINGKISQVQANIDSNVGEYFAMNHDNGFNHDQDNSYSQDWLNQGSYDSDDFDFDFDFNIEKLSDFDFSSLPDLDVSVPDFNFASIDDKMPDFHFDNSFFDQTDFGFADLSNNSFQFGEQSGGFSFHNSNGWKRSTALNHTPILGVLHKSLSQQWVDLPLRVGTIA